MKSLDEIAGANGMKIISVAATYTKLRANFFIPREDSVISVCLGLDAAGEIVDILARNNWGVTLKVSDDCTLPKGWVITDITLDSGSLQCF